MDGGFPKKLARQAKIPIEQAQAIFDNYHNVLYTEITTMRNNVLKYAKEHGYIHLGLGCIMNTSNPEQELRTIFNACSQFWSILTLLTINKLNHLIEINNYQNNIEVVSTIYDSIYLYMDLNPYLIKWLNDTIIPILTTDFLEDTIVKNEAVGAIGFNWYDIVEISNGASIEEIEEVIKKISKMVKNS